MSIRQSVAYLVMMKAYDSADHLSPKTGATLAVKLSKAGSAFADPSAGASNATEVANGWYKYSLSTTDTNTLGDLVVRLTGTGTDDSERILQVEDIGSITLTEAYPAITGNATLAQLLYEIAQVLGEFGIVSTTLTVKKRDRSTTAEVYTLDDAVSPASRTRTT